MTRHSSALVPRLAAIFAGAIIAASCQTSAIPRNIPAATSPYGSKAAVTLADGKIVKGELLAITDTSWVMLVDKRIAAVRTSAIALGRVSDMTDVTRVTNVSEMPDAIEVRYANGKTSSEEMVASARRLARFPYGMPPGALAQLLAKTSQSAPDDLEAKP